MNGYEIVTTDVIAAGTVYCPTGKRVLSGGAQITDNAGRYYALEVSGPKGQIGWTASAILVEDHNAVTSDFDLVRPPLALRIWAICATTS